MNLRLAVAVLAIALAIVFDGARRQRIHNENMADAELFKREFDAHVTTSTPLAGVEEYLRGKPVKVTRSTGFRDGRDFVKELMIEVAHERSVHWYCGKILRRAHSWIQRRAVNWQLRIVVEVRLSVRLAGGWSQVEACGPELGRCSLRLVPV